MPRASPFLAALALLAATLAAGPRATSSRSAASSRRGWSLATVLLASTVAAGCLAAPASVDEPLAPARSRDPPLAASSHPWEVGSGTTEIGEAVDVPVGAGALVVDYEAQVPARGNLRILAHGPDDEAHTVAWGGAPLLGAGRSVGFAVLPPLPGAWTFSAETTSGASGVLNVTVLAPRAAPIPVAGAGADRVVVAVVDTGVNPYHDVFQAGLATADLPARVVDAGTGLPPLSVDIVRDEDWITSVRNDGALWAQVPGQTLVHFAGTNVLGYHLDETELPRLPVLDRAGHGTAVSHSVVAENPDVLVVMITGDDWDAGVRWATSQPWIDLVSLSWGPPANALGPAFDTLGWFVTPEATLEAHRAGKVVFAASGNDPTPTFSDTTSGPPWVHAVSGAESAVRGRAVLSGNFVDTVANWTQDLARLNSLDRTGTASGTSFATPTTAGVASRILHETRLGAGHQGGIVDGALVRTETLTLTGKDLRDAMNATAFWWGTTEYGGASGRIPAAPVLPTPWISMGWGVVDGSVVDRAVRGLLGEEPWPTKPAEAQAWMRAQLSLRETMWR